MSCIRALLLHFRLWHIATYCAAARFRGKADVAFVASRRRGYGYNAITNYGITVTVHLIRKTGSGIALVSGFVVG
jgi:hypothetical protein